MSPDVIALLVLAAVFLIATVRPVNMGALALVAAFVVGTYVFGVETADVLGGFPASLFVILVGVTYLFALAKNNGTVDWLVHAAVRAVGGRVSLIPWALALVAGAITAIGAVTPAAVAIIAPVAMQFAVRNRINPVLMGFMVVQGATAGSFSPIGVFGIITNTVVRDNDFDQFPVRLFLGSVITAVVLNVIAYVVYRNRDLDGGRIDRSGRDEAFSVDALAASATTRTPVQGTPSALVERGERLRHSGGRGGGGQGEEPEVVSPSLDAQKSLTLAGLALLAVLALAFGLDVGFTALAVAVLLTLLFPASAKGAVDKVSWGTVLLIGGIVTYVALLEEQGTIDRFGDAVAGFGTPLLAALVICFIGAIVSAFASTTGILGTLIPLSVPFLLAGEVGTVGLVVALAISSSVVDCSPFSTNGALVVANSEPEMRDKIFRSLMILGMGLVVVAPLVTWLALVVTTS
ncbi:SLC13 family permease [uncultured Pseudokineococcus sp.]|uniref:SLC13 family permease n=1 Tax=uncultured Pseudokineococcus sp. TaxID=1642928 RepID=UPI00262249E1|nr:SLC13 family permease [uncultured Pseudokineococcus sp.]